MKSSRGALWSILVCAALGMLPGMGFGQGPGSSFRPPGATSGQYMPQTGSARSASSTGKGSLSAADKKFVMDAAKGGQAKVKLGQLASEKAAKPEVKQFGERMMKDHMQAGDQLKQVARAQGITLSQSLSPQDQRMADQLSKLNGSQFDEAYMRLMVKDHKRDVADFQRESKGGTNPAVKEFAAATLPTLQDHLRQAETLSPEPSDTRMQSERQ